MYVIILGIVGKRRGKDEERVKYNRTAERKIRTHSKAEHIKKQNKFIKA